MAAGSEVNAPASDTMAPMFALRRFPGRPLVIGHRGARGHAPENTLAAFRLGAEMGADLVECDVHLSRDGQLVVIHDDTLERTTSGKGLVRETDLATLKSLDAGQGEPVPALDDLLALAAGHPPLGVVVEIKNGPTFYPDIDVAVAGALRRHGLVDRAIVISFDHLVIRAIKERLPEVATGILYHARLADPAQAARSALADSIWPSLAMLSPEVSRAAHDAGLAVFTWTANSPAEFSRSIGGGADGIGTDFPDALADHLAATKVRNDAHDETKRNQPGEK